MTKQLTFSRQIKDELSQLPCPESCCRQAEICAAFFGAGRFFKGTLSLSTAHVGCARRLANLIQQEYQCEIGWQAGRELINLSIDQPDLYQAICMNISRLFDFDPTDEGKWTPAAKETARIADPNEDGPLACLSDCCRQAALRALFLTCGSISEPAAAYHLELSLRQTRAAEMTMAILNQFEIRAGLLKRHGYSVLYLKEGQYISDFLLLTGAHHALLNFESLRVEKEMRNSVNRVVNCDSANSQRIANTAARQLELIRKIIDRYGIGLLPKDLQAAAMIRLDNPDLSLKELGEMMQPQLGKSGMNHRLHRLEQFAADVLSKKSLEE